MEGGNDRLPHATTTSQQHSSTASRAPVLPPSYHASRNSPLVQDHGYLCVVDRRQTVKERLASTLAIAKAEQAKYARRAKLTSMAVNGAMFVQVILSALVTGLAAAAPNRRHAQIGVSALGALGTILASFLVRIRSTREPERSMAHSQNLETYIRKLEVFIADEGLSTDRKWDATVRGFRAEFDALQTRAHHSESGQSLGSRSDAV